MAIAVKWTDISISYMVTPKLLLPKPVSKV